MPLLILLVVIWYVPESPRWLVKEGREEEARFILGRLRGETGKDEGKAEAEFRDIVNVRELEKSTAKQQTYIAMFFGLGSGKLHTGRRVQLVVWLQILQEWIGIAGITIFGPVIFGFAGIKPADQQWVSGLNDITYMVSGLALVLSLQRPPTKSLSLLPLSASSPLIGSVVAGRSTGVPSVKASAVSSSAALANSPPISVLATPQKRHMSEVRRPFSSFYTR